MKRSGERSAAAPRIPPPPPGAGRRARRGDRRLSIWILAFGAGLALGALGYEGLGAVRASFDYWLALALG